MKADPSLSTQPNRFGILASELEPEDEEEENLKDHFKALEWKVLAPRKILLSGGAQPRPASQHDQR